MAILHSTALDSSWLYTHLKKKTTFFRNTIWKNTVWKKYYMENTIWNTNIAKVWQYWWILQLANSNTLKRNFQKCLSKSGLLPKCGNITVCISGYSSWLIVTLGIGIPPPHHLCCSAIFGQKKCKTVFGQKKRKTTPMPPNCQMGVCEDGQQIEAHKASSSQFWIFWSCHINEAI